MNRHVLIGILALASCVSLSMEKKRKEPSIPFTISKRINYEDLSTLEKLPRELQVKIIADIISGSYTARDAFNELNKIKALNTHFYTLLNSPDALKIIIPALAKRFYHNDAIKAAEFLNTKAAKEWINSILPVHIQKNINNLAQNNYLALTKGDFSSIHNYLKTSMDNQLISTRMYNPAAMIWLFKTILHTAQFRKFTLEELAKAFYPEYPQNINPEVKEWLDAAVTAIIASLPFSLSTQTAEYMQKLIGRRLDLSLNVSNEMPVLFYVTRPEIIELVLQAGVPINTQYADTGNTALHFMIITEVHPGSEKNLKAYQAIEFLLKNGANPNIKNNKGETALDLVKQKKKNSQESGSAQDPFFDRLSELLQKYAAK